MTPALITGLVSVLVGLLPAFCYFVIVGLALRVLAGPGRLPDGLFLTAALGVAASGYLVTVGYVLFRTLTPVIGTVGLAAAAVLGAALWRRRPPVPSWRALVDGADLAGLCGALLGLAPVLAFGRRYWTMGTHDFPNYMASVHVWLGLAGEGPDFRARHPDAWGDYMADRAGFEKPVVTGLMVIVRTVGRVQPESQLALFMLLALGILIAALVTAVREQFGLGTWWATACVLAPVLSLGPMARIHHGQVGQALSLALLAAFLAVVPSVARTRSRGGTLGMTVLLAVLVAAATGANFTLVLGAAPVIVAFAVLRLTVTTRRIGRVLRRLVPVAVFTVVFSVPLIPLYLVSLRLQGPGDGYPVPLPSPLTLIGVDPPRELGTVAWALVGWAVVAAAGAVGCGWLVRRRPARAVGPVVVFAAVTLTGLGLFLYYGPESYNSHKWLVMVSPLIGSFLLGALLRPGRPGPTALGRPAVLVCCVVAAVLSHRAGSAMTIVLSEEVYALEDAPALEDVQILNIDLGRSDTGVISEAGVAGLLVPSAQVHMVSTYPALQRPPVGHRFLVRTDTPLSGQVRDRVPLNDEYEVQDVWAPLEWGTNPVGQDPADPGLLYDQWHPPEGDGAWSGGSSVWVGFDVPPHAGDVTVRLTGYRFVVDGPREVRILSGDRVVAQHLYRDRAETDLSFVLAPQDMPDGQVTLQIQAPDPVTAGAEDPRELGFFLSSITLERDGS